MPAYMLALSGASVRNSNGYPTVLLADDNERVLLRVSQLLSGTYDVIEMVDDGSQAVRAIARLVPDIAVLDISMPGLDGIGVACQLRQMQCHTRIVFLTMHNDEDYISAAIASGADGYVLKRYMRTELIHAIEEARAGRCFVSSHAVSEK